MIWADDGSVVRATGAREVYTEEDLLQYRDHKSVDALVADHKTAEDTSCRPQAENSGAALGRLGAPSSNPNSTEIEPKPCTPLVNSNSPTVATLQDATRDDGLYQSGTFSAPSVLKSDGFNAQGATPKQDILDLATSRTNDQTNPTKETVPELAKVPKLGPKVADSTQEWVSKKIFEKETKRLELEVANLKLIVSKKAGQTKFSEWIRKYHSRVIYYGFPLCMTTFFGLGYFLAHSNLAREAAGASAAAQPPNPAFANKSLATGTLPAKQCENPSQLAIFKIKEIAVGISPPSKEAIVKYIDGNCFSEMSEECGVSARQQINSELDAARYPIAPLPIQVSLPSLCADKLSEARAGTGGIISVEMSGPLRTTGSAEAPFRREAFSKLEELVAMPSTSRLQIDVEVPKGCAGNICQSSQAELERIILASIQTFSGRQVSAKVTFVQAGNVGSKWLWRAQAFN